MDTSSWRATSSQCEMIIPVAAGLEHPYFSQMKPINILGTVLLFLSSLYLKKIFADMKYTSQSTLCINLNLDGTLTN